MKETYRRIGRLALLVSVLMLLSENHPASLWAGDPQVHAAWNRQYPPDQYLVGSGQGDLAKGRLVCQRVSEIAARTDVARQIRVLVKERATDRVRERTGAPAEQDLEIVREESVTEYLQDVKIVDHRVDEAAGTCSSVAVMARSRIAPKPGVPLEDPPAK